MPVTDWPDWPTPPRTPKTRPKKSVSATCEIETEKVEIVDMLPPIEKPKRTKADEKKHENEMRTAAVRTMEIDELSDAASEQDFEKWTAYQTEKSSIGNVSEGAQSFATPDKLSRSSAVRTIFFTWVEKKKRQPLPEVVAEFYTAETEVTQGDALVGNLQRIVSQMISKVENSIDIVADGNDSGDSEDDVSDSERLQIVEDLPTDLKEATAVILTAVNQTSFQFNKQLKNMGASEYIVDMKQIKYVSKFEHGPKTGRRHLHLSMCGTFFGMKTIQKNLRERGVTVDMRCSEGDVYEHCVVYQLCPNISKETEGEYMSMGKIPRTVNELLAKQKNSRRRLHGHQVESFIQRSKALRTYEDILRVSKTDAQDNIKDEVEQLRSTLPEHFRRCLRVYLASNIVVLKDTIAEFLNRKQLTQEEETNHTTPGAILTALQQKCACTDHNQEEGFVLRMLHAHWDRYIDGDGDKMATYWCWLRTYIVAPEMLRRVFKARNMWLEGMGDGGKTQLINLLTRFIPYVQFFFYIST
jgi:hypothetical protein